MKQIVVCCVMLAFSVVAMTRAADVAKPEADLKREPPAGANSNLVEDPRPQLAPNPHVGPEVPMVAEAPRPASRSEPQVAEAAPGAAQRRKTGGMVLAVLVVVAASYLLQRWRSRSDPS
jgi:hypothetical protein